MYKLDLDCRQAGYKQRSADTANALREPIGARAQLSTGHHPPPRRAGPPPATLGEMAVCAGATVDEGGRDINEPLGYCYYCIKRGVYPMVL